MKFKHRSLLPLLAFLGEGINAQRFDEFMLAVDYPGIGDTCADALNTTVSNCPYFLGSVSIDNPRLDSDQLSLLCTSDCRTSLTSVRQTIATGCNQDSDIISLDDIDWPATLVIDRFLYTYDLSCRKDSASGQFCDEIFFSWLNQSTLTAAQNCSDCMLGVVQTQLNSPFGYDNDFAQDFQSATASCGASGYAFTSPAPYALNSSATTPSSPTSTPTCSDPYQVQPGDSCDSIATSKTVSTYAVLSAGGLNPTCTNLLAGSSLCLPGSCDLYRVQYGDTCESIIATKSGLTGNNLLAWNPNINVLCGNIKSLVETLICVSPPGGSLGQITLSTPLAVSTATTPVPKPTNAPEESNSRCAKWYVIQEGDYCDSVSIHQNIALKDFYFLNPEINVNCTNLLLGLAYCVQAVGEISTYSGYPSSSKMYTLTSLTYTTTTSTLPAVPASTTALTPLPTAPGTVSDCQAYVEYVPVPGLTDQSQSPDVSVMTDKINSCDYVISGYGVALSDFLSWNPSLSSVSPCTLQANYCYCASNSSSAEPQDQAGDLCIPVDDIYPGTITTCSCFTSIEASTSGIRLCSDIASDANITVAQLMTWNPWVGSDCDTGVYVNLGATDTRAVCIGVNSTAPTATASGVSSTSVTLTNSGTTSMGPTQTGIVAGCTQYYTVQAGDSCAAIDAQFSITFDQFYAWNPAVGSNCESLWIGYAYCVAAPTSTTSTASAAVTTPPAPTRSGTPETCTTYYTVQTGDGCWSIGQMFAIDFATLYRWNPSVGSNCESLWAGYSLCVAGGPYA